MGYWAPPLGLRVCGYGTTGGKTWDGRLGRLLWVHSLSVVVSVNSQGTASGPICLTMFRVRRVAVHGCTRGEHYGRMGRLLWELCQVARFGTGFDVPAGVFRPPFSYYSADAARLRAQSMGQAIGGRIWDVGACQGGGIGILTALLMGWVQGRRLWD